MSTNARFAILSISLLFLNVGAVWARDLTFEERVALQGSIERVYYSHQAGTTASFEQAVPNQVLERKVRNYLAQSVALDRFWSTPVTEEMLQGEAWRMVKNTRQPERLEELFAAVGNDPFLFQETVVRSVLAARLSRNFFAFDESIQGNSRHLAETLRQELSNGHVDPLSPHPLRVIVELRQQSDSSLASGENPEELATSSGQGQVVRINLTEDEFVSRSAGITEAAGEIGPVREEATAFQIRVVLERIPGLLRYARFSVPKVSWDEWWAGTEALLASTPVTPVAEPDALLAGALSRSEEPAGRPSTEVATGTNTSNGALCVNDTWNNGSLESGLDARTLSSAVWTGTRMIVWGGFGTTALNTGGLYDPATDTWEPTSTLNAPLPRFQHTAIWTGSRMVVWGGRSDRTGGIYDPLSNSWVPTSTTNAPFFSVLHTAVWTGNYMVVWSGGNPQFPAPSGGRYNPSTNTWLPVSTLNAPSPRSGHTAVWTDQKMLVWGGQSQDPATGQVEYLNDGAGYDPASDTWSPISAANAPSARSSHTAVWTGTRMVIWGGSDGASFPTAGGLYDPASNSWSETSQTGAPPGRWRHIAQWTGSQMIVWGGDNQADLVADGGRYDPIGNSWLTMSRMNAPIKRSDSVAVWTGSLAIVWGGSGSAGTSLNSGGRYNPILDTWTPTSPTTPVIIGPGAVWTGNAMLVWGLSLDDQAPVGERYDPGTDAWSPISTLGAPSARANFTLVWTGSRMLVWGGVFLGAYLNTGGRYDPLTDTWSEMSVVNAPSGRWGHTAIWTGTEMIVWGGTSFDYDAGVNRLWNTGGRYDPVSDVWHPTSTAGAPAGRREPTAVWTGHRMVVWGGLADPTYQNTGGRYDPVTDSWAATTLTNAPTGRWEHRAVWTGRFMVAWGGVGPVGANLRLLSTGGRYDPDNDTWQPTSNVGAASARGSHTAVWTGAVMIVWGGRPSTTATTGSRYDPLLDGWSAISAIGAPSPRFSHVAVWTGSVMIVWGGHNDFFWTNSGGRYCACTGSIGTYYQDADGDGYGDPAVSVPPCSTIPPGYVPIGGDCNDGNRAIHPGAAEQCDGVDENCNGQIDDGVLQITCPPDQTRQCPATLGDIGFPVVVSSCDPSPVVVHDSPELLPLGASLITWSAADAFGHQASCFQTIEGVDTIPPGVVLTLHPAGLWPPDHRLVDVTASVIAGDACNQALGLAPSIALLSVTSSEPDDAVGAGDGQTSGDIRDVDPGTADFAFTLRAERDGRGGGRLYEVTYAATDSAGNQGQGSALVLVPRDSAGAIEPLNMTVDSTPEGTVLQWGAVPGALLYSVIRGESSQVRETDESIDLGPVSCITTTSATNSVGKEDRQVPSPGEVFFYLIAYDDGQRGAYGTESAGKPRVPTSGSCW